MRRRAGPKGRSRENDKVMKKAMLVLAAALMAPAVVFAQDGSQAAPQGQEQSQPQAQPAGGQAPAAKRAETLKERREKHAQMLKERREKRAEMRKKRMEMRKERREKRAEMRKKRMEMRKERREKNGAAAPQHGAQTPAPAPAQDGTAPAGQ